MALPNSYLVTTKNLQNFLNSVISAQAPDKFTNKFLSDLGFTSSNDRLLIGMLKTLGFLEESGTPTQRYYDFMDQTQSKKIMAIAIREAYKELFMLRKDAQSFSEEEVKNKFKTLTQGQKSNNVLKWMTSTFTALCDYADFSENVSATVKEEPKSEIEVPPTANSIPQIESTHSKKTELHYNIQIHLPETRDMAVYDAIFQSLKKHIL